VARRRAAVRVLLARHKVREYWLVDPIQHTLERHELDRGLLTLVSVIDRSGTLESPFFPGLSVRAAGVFAD
jgi:Uma2 family endonuclease